MNYSHFLKLGQWTHNGRTIAAEYMFKGLLVHLRDKLIILDDGSHVSFLSFVKENIQHQYKYMK
ncbi:secretion protein EspN [Salmonella bongori]|nr:secretion protein EspN [Salmonella bongori]